MRISPISNTYSTNFRGAESEAGKILEKAAATLPVKTSANRKTISIELHNALTKLTAYRVALLFSALSGFFGYHAADKKADHETADFANTVQTADIDTEAGFEIQDMNHDGTADIVLQKKDGSKVILDLKNSNVLVESTGFKEIE